MFGGLNIEIADNVMENGDEQKVNENKITTNDAKEKAKAAFAKAKQLLKAKKSTESIQYKYQFTQALELESTSSNQFNKKLNESSLLRISPSPSISPSPP